MQAIQQLLGPIGTIFHYIFYQPVYNILMVLYQAFHTFLPSGAFALAIVVLTLLLRAALIPLTRKQLKSSRAMQVLQPQLKELQARYKNRPQELMAAQQALYKEHGVNPVSGCLPLLIQMPFIYALYGAFETVIYAHGTLDEKLTKINSDLYSFVPHLHRLPDTFFFWTSLAQPDSLHILPILAAVLTFLQLRMALPVRKPSAGPKDTMSQATGMMQYFMPVMTLVIGLTFPAGLALYWCVSTLFSAVQQYFISGWGSLFVGIPGMEHLVPEPQQPAAPTPSKAVSPGAARALTAPTAPAEPSAGGLRGMLKQIKEQISAAQQNALETQKARQNGTPASEKPQTAAKSATGSAVDAGGAPAAAKPEAAPRRERPRASRAGPVLIKPPAAKTATGETPAPAATPSASGPAPVESKPAPLTTDITHIVPNGSAANGVGDKSGKNGNHVVPPPTSAEGEAGGEPSLAKGAAQESDSGKNGNLPAATGVKRAAASVSPSSRHPAGHPPTPHKGGPGAASGQRKSSGASGGKGGQSSARSRGSRPKGAKR